MFVAGLAYVIGSILMGFSVNLPMLIIGRFMLGVGVGFANSSGPLYLSEMPPCASQLAIACCSFCCVLDTHLQPQRSSIIVMFTFSRHMPVLPCLVRHIITS